MVVAHRKALQMTKEIVAHLIFDAPRRADDDPPLQVEKESLDCRRGDEQKAVADQRRTGDRFRQLIHSAADDGWFQQREDRRADDTKTAEGQRFFVSGEIREQTAQWS